MNTATNADYKIQVTQTASGPLKVRLSRVLACQRSWQARALACLLGWHHESYEDGARHWTQSFADLLLEPVSPSL